MVYSQFPELHADLFSRHASPSDVCVMWRSTEEVNIACPTRFVVDATENSKEGVAADPDWAMNKIKRQHTIAHTWVTRMKSLSS